jgi:hypothetical protein
MARSTITIKCSECQKDIEKIKSDYNRKIKAGQKDFFCNNTCSGIFANKKNPAHLEKYRDENGAFLNGHANNRLDEYSPFKYYRNKARLKNKEKGLDIDLTKEYLKNLYESQNGECTLTGLKMDLPRTTQDADIKKSPIKASLDRIDSDLPYQMGNVQFVCYSANMAKNDFTQKESLEFFKNIKSKNLKEAINLLRQIIEKNLYDDKKENPKKDGTSWNVYHLTLLLSLLENEIKSNF